VLRTVLAPNPSPMTLQGTQTYVIGSREFAVVDPGSAAATHLDALAAFADEGVCVAVIVTHDHPDHIGGAPELAKRVGAPMLRFGAGLTDGTTISTDTGELVALHTPGHTRDHVSLWWAAERAVFCGDLMMGGLDTALVAPPEGDLGDYLASLRRIAELKPDVVYPAHGPPFTTPLEAIERYRQHRTEREDQVLQGLSGQPANEDQLTDRVYGQSIEPALRPYARSAIEAYLQHLEKNGRVKRGRMGWEKTV
jgi:glyoxylase-like metal-dependent hydrolase (beta-lactamase superfamily II)